MNRQVAQPEHIVDWLHNVDSRNDRRLLIGWPVWRGGPCISIASNLPNCPFGSAYSLLPSTSRIVPFSPSPINHIRYSSPRTQDLALRITSSRLSRGKDYCCHRSNLKHARCSLKQFLPFLLVDNTNMSRILRASAPCAPSYRLSSCQLGTKHDASEAFVCSRFTDNNWI